MWQKLLVHPAKRGLLLDDPRIIEAEKTVISAKPFLRRIYREWYDLISDNLPVGGDPVLEIGSGAGLLKEIVPDLILSDVLRSTDISTVIDAQRLPFAHNALRAIVMCNVLHHIPVEIGRAACRERV